MLRACVIFIFFYLCVIFDLVSASEESKVVILADGAVKGNKYWDGEFFEFYGVPYAEAPKGRDRFQAPLPPKPWEGLLDASDKKTLCQQSYIAGDDTEDTMFDGAEDCLLMNLLVPQVASENNLVPVVVYIHSGAFSGGSSHMANLNYVARHDVIAISFNYRVGALGFACLGNKEIPGNAALKDQVAALRWINKNIKKFGGDPNKVTLAGFSVGATMAELLSLSKATTGLFSKIILESGSALAPFAINRHPITTAKNIAISLGYNETITLEGLTEFYLTTNITGLAKKSVNYHLKNSTFGFAPCVENILEDIEPVITESPLETLKKGRNNDVAVLTGFADQEGLSRSIKFGTWREEMTEDMSEFLPADLLFNDDKAKDKVINEIKKYYFDNKPVNAEALQKYTDYFSDSMFKYNILKSAKLHAATSKKPVYLYEFSYSGKLNIEHNYVDRIKGASHRDQTAYILDFLSFTNNYKDLDTRDRMTTMWTDFVKYENPTLFESHIINTKWLPYTNSKRHYMEINKKLQIKTSLFENGYNFWDKVYKKYYWSPAPPKFEETIEKNEEPKKDTVIKKESTKKKEKVATKAKESLLEINTLKKEKETLKKTKKEVETVKENNAKTGKNTLDDNGTPENMDSLKDSNKDKNTLNEEEIPKKVKNSKQKNTKEEVNNLKESNAAKNKNTPKKNDATDKAKETDSKTVNNNLKVNSENKKDVPKDKGTLSQKDTSNKKDSKKESNTPKQDATLKVNSDAKEKDPGEKGTSRNI